MSEIGVQKREKKRSYVANRISYPVNIVWNILFALASLSCILPLILVIMVSLTDEKSLVQYGYSFFPHVFGLSGYEYIMKKGGAVLSSYSVSILVALVGTVLSTMVIALYAYPLSRPNFKYKGLFTGLVFVTMLFSGGLVPWYIMYTQVLGIGNTIAVLIIPYLMNAWYVLILRTFFKSAVPEELLESARIDGANEFHIFAGIALPLSTAGLATVGLFSMILYWNDWYLPLMFIRSENLYNVQYLLKSILENVQFLARMSTQVAGIGGAVKDLPSETIRMSIAVIAVGPIILAYPFFQRYFIKGLTIGAVKG
ncbi:MAG: carbohydrate ABC transporter permease [Clostridiales bacterium]|nr:carbohydrate ABC transporter permease [Clostridiales bacterium]